MRRCQKEKPDRNHCTQGYRFCNRLYALERKLEDLTDEERQIQRQKQAKPILYAYWTWVDTIACPPAS